MHTNAQRQAGNASSLLPWAQVVRRLGGAPGAADVAAAAAGTLPTPHPLVQQSIRSFLQPHPRAPTLAELAGRAPGARAPAASGARVWMQLLVLAAGAAAAVPLSKRPTLQLLNGNQCPAASPLCHRAHQAALPEEHAGVPEQLGRA